MKNIFKTSLLLLVFLFNISTAFASFPSQTINCTYSESHFSCTGYDESYFTISYYAGPESGVYSFLAGYTPDIIGRLPNGSGVMYKYVSPSRRGILLINGNGQVVVDSKNSAWQLIKEHDDNNHGHAIDIYHYYCDGPASGCPYAPC